jgi:drug/metabolite transporter (DMT)-like permease
VAGAWRGVAFRRADSGLLLDRAPCRAAYTGFLQLPPVVWLAIFYLSIFTTAGTFFLLQFACLRLPASKVMAYGYLTPSFIIVIEGIIGHGWAAPRIMAGAAVTAVALAVMAVSSDG